MGEPMTWMMAPVVAICDVLRYKGEARPPAALRRLSRWVEGGLE